MAHITAGDLSPVTYLIENEYGTPAGTAQYYADVAEGGKFTIQDNSNPYLAWRYGSRSFDPADYVTQQMDAAFSAILEVRDALGWDRIIEYAVGTGGGTAPYGPLPSRTEQIHVRTDRNAWQGRAYHGCKTDSLTIKADAPGSIVQFEESVLASYAEDDDLLAPLGPWVSGTPAVQWLSGAKIGLVQVYPQSFSISVSNALGRSYKPTNGQAITGALLEGRREITAEFDLWMEDLANIRASIANASVSNIELTLGIAAPVKITLTGVRWMADGDYSDLVQDKQREKLKFRAAGMVAAAVSTATLGASPAGTEEPSEDPQGA